METQSEPLVGVDEGASASIPEAVEPPTGDGTPVPEEVQGEPEGGPPKGYETVPPELWPDKDGNPPKLTEELMRKLRGRYFTVKHPRLTCGHKLDQINQPKNNCDECWAAFFGTHAQLVEVAHQFYQTQGRGPMVAMRGGKFVKNFERFMSMMFQEMKRRQKEEELKRAIQEPGESAPMEGGQQDSTPTVQPAELSGEQAGA